MAAKKQKLGIHKCIDCKMAELMQWRNNPVIAQCNAHRNREVANAPKICDAWKQDMKDKTIRKME